MSKVVSPWPTRPGVRFPQGQHPLPGPLPRRWIFYALQHPIGLWIDRGVVGMTSPENSLRRVIQPPTEIAVMFCATNGARRMEGNEGDHGHPWPHVIEQVDGGEAGVANADDPPVR
jgi:hypothetical protein